MSKYDVVSMYVCMYVSRMRAATTGDAVSSYRRTIGSTRSSAVLGAVVCDGDAGVDVDSRNGHGTYAASEKLSDVCPPPLVSRLAWPISYNDACGPHPAGRRGCAVRARNDPQQRLPPFVYVSFGLRTHCGPIDRSIDERESKKLWLVVPPSTFLSLIYYYCICCVELQQRTNER